MSREYVCGCAFTDSGRKETLCEEGRRLELRYFEALGDPRHLCPECDDPVREEVTDRRRGELARHFSVPFIEI